MKSIKNPGVHYDYIIIKQFATKATEHSCTQSVTVYFEHVSNTIIIENLFHFNGKICFSKYRYFKGTVAEAKKFGKTLNWS